MHKTLTIASFVLLSWSSLEAQTNVFPSVGNAGVGTTTPAYPLTLQIGNGALFGFDGTTALGKVSFGKQPYLQLTGDGSTNNGPGLALFQLNIGATGTYQSASELSIAATRGTTTASRVAVQNGDLLGRISWFGDDGTDMRSRGTIIESTVDTSTTAVTTQVIPARLSFGTVEAAPIVFYTNAGNGAVGRYYGGANSLAVIGSNERMRITATGNVGIGSSVPGGRLHVATNISGPVLKLTDSDADELVMGEMGGGPGRFDFQLLDTPSAPKKLMFFGGNSSNGYQMGWFLVQATVSAFSGNVGIGTTNPGAYKLAVNGTVRAKEVIVDTGWSDYVFAPDYKLAPLSEVEAHIKENGHLPGIPSAKEVTEHGVSMGEMQAKLLAKIEELTLHQIEQEKRQQEQDDRIRKLEAENLALRAR